MTRKDYILLAEALRVSHRRATLSGFDGAQTAVADAASELADALKRDNSRFNHDHFMAVVRGEKELMSRPSRNGVRA